MAGNVACKEGNKKAHKILVGQSDAKRLLW